MTLLAAHVVRFIEQRIDSVPALEALLMMRDDPRPWGVAEMAARVYVGEDRARSLLETLVRQQLLAAVAPGQYQFSPADDTLRLLVGDVARTYRANLAQVATLIHDRASGSVREFARAFDLKKDR